MQDAENSTGQRARQHTAAINPPILSSCRMRNINPSGLLQAFTMSDLFDLSDDIRADSCQTATQNTSGAFAAFRLHVAKM